MSFGGRTIHNDQQRIAGVSIQSSAYGMPIPIVFGKTRVTGNLIGYSDFTAIAHTSSESAGGKGGGGVTTVSTTYTYTAAVMNGLAEGPIHAIGQVWASKELTTMSALGLTLFTGTYPQTAWGFMTTNHPTQALGYSGLAYVANSALDLGGSASLPNLSFEVTGFNPYNLGTIDDANPKDVVNVLLTDANCGAGWDAARVGDLTQFSNYCVAMGIFVSPAFKDQKPAAEQITSVVEACNTAPVWSEGVLKFIPYGDSVVTGNSVTFTPNITPVYDLTDDDFLGSGVDPIECTRKQTSDAYNQVQIEFLNRANAYNPEIAEAKDQANIDIYGLRPNSPDQVHMVCDKTIAQTVVQTKLQRALYIRNVYRFKLGWRFMRLEPMDIVTLTDSRLGLDKAQVRITEIEESEDGELDVIAEEFPFGVATPALYSTQTAGGYSVNFNSAPSNSNTPIIFEAPVAIASSGLEVWAAVCGGANWGGCEVWVSSDNATYRRVGTIHGSARMGTLTNGLNVGLDPDTINTLSVDLTESSGTLISGTTADADAHHTLCYVDGELMSYRDATLTAANKYNLGYLRRGAYGTTIGNHATGSAFARLDDAIFVYPYSADQIGKTLYFKFPAFNIYAMGQQDLATATAYTHTIAGPPAPPNVTGFAVKQSGGTVVFTWNRVTDFALKGYDIRYGATTLTNWTDLTPLTEAAMGTEMTNASVPPGAWQFAIRARDIADQLSPTMATTTLTVTNENATIATRQECPALDGTVSGFIQHWTGVLAPLGTFACSHYTHWEDFGVVYLGSTPYVPDPVATATYTQNAQDTTYNDTLRVWAIITATPGPSVTGTPTTAFSLDHWLTGETDPATWTPWTSGSAQLRYFRGRVTETPGTVPSYISVFTVTADKATANKADGANETVAAGGTAVVFSTVFHSPPFVTCTVVGAGALFATATNITETGCTLHVFNTSGTDVGGTVNWTATGY